MSDTQKTGLSGLNSISGLKKKAFCLLLFVIAVGASDCFAGDINMSSNIKREHSKTFHSITLKSELTDSGNKECYVWFETNSEKYVEKYIAKSKGWALIGKPIITGRIYNIESFVQRLREVGIDALAGFKTSAAFTSGDYADEASWRHIAGVAKNVSTLTEGKPVILENEGTVKAMISRGVRAIEYEKLLKAISAQQWPEIWFWYAPLGQEEPLKSISYDIARAVKNGIPNCRLIEPNSAGFSNSALNRNCKENLERTFYLDRDPISIIYLDDHKTNYWALENTCSAFRAAAGRTVILYPGLDDIGNSGVVRKCVRIE